jgi:hypothetical protein
MLWNGNFNGFIYLNYGKIKRDRWHNSESKHAVLLTLRSVSMQCSSTYAMQYYNTIQCNAMQCNAIQCNAIMQCNAMQVNVMYGSPSVRTEWSQSVIFLFFYFFLVSMYGSPSVYGTRMSRMDRQVSFLVSMYECHGWTDKFQLFQFSFSSVAYSQVSLSVRTEVPTKKRKRKNVTDKHRNTDPIGGNTFNGKKICS